MITILIKEMYFPNRHFSPFEFPALFIILNPEAYMSLSVFYQNIHQMKLLNFLWLLSSFPAGCHVS